MIPSGLFTQIGMVMLSLGIIFTYIKPELEKIKIINETIVSYEEQGKTVLEVNSLLSGYLAKKDSLSSENIARLNKYLPNEVDLISVQRDLYLITKQAGLVYVNSETSDTKSNSRKKENIVSSDNLPTQHQVSLLVEGTYSQVKDLLKLLQQNEYPLEVSSMSIAPTEGGFMKVEFTLNTYSYNKLDNNVI